MNGIGLFLPGNSLLHRLPPGVKLIALLVLEVAIVLGVRTPLWTAAALVALAGLYALAKINAKLAWQRLRMIAALAVIVGAAQAFVIGPPRAAVAAGQLFLCVALASLVTLTTRTSELLEALERWLAPTARIGVDPSRIALLLALAIRSIPVVAELADQVAQAHRARGARLTPITLAVPLVIRTLTHATVVGEALQARGVDD